jgi:hypothetical protein
MEIYFFGAASPIFACGGKQSARRFVIVKKVLAAKILVESISLESR